MGGGLILFEKRNGLRKVYIKLIFLLILFIGTINNFTTTTGPVFV